MITIFSYLALLIGASLITVICYYSLVKIKLI
ncbi:petL (chloroplast) [Auxenochlorella protothecoides x Auxenochlorella symbiontica]|uniref:Cytochrome b6-f complex subunit 6 n=1 Tax=Auxenochlorella protothecoides TaxID=3075 RepID=A0A023HHV1_AUXPR|nr:subunit VI of cytochrome b6/f complex [Auxenochlorella protothecoides]AGL10885.1 subunit VI of cytochrome b6/f complex [Auxenochlorella protothecoides]AGN72452.1 cytochrome b6/f complex subunit VI [Auxenochlorella protothecoides]